MKKTIFAILLLAGVAAQTQAQEKKFWIGGSVEFESTDFSSTESNNSFFILPEFGYAFSDRWAAGIQLGFGQAKSTTDNSHSDFKADVFSIAPFARHTFLNWKAFRVFVDGGLAYSFANGRVNDDSFVTDTDNEISSFGIFLSPGFSLRLSDVISLTGRTNFFNAGYTQIKTSLSGDDTTESWSADLNSPFSLGNFTVGFNFSF